MTDASQQLPVPREQRPREAFVGLMPRSAALLIDMVLIYFAGYTLALGLRRPLMDLGPWLPLLSTALAFIYFWLGNGPVGGGATFGKAILNLHVSTTAGEGRAIPGYGQAFRRTLLQFPLIYLALYQFGRSLLDVPPMWGALGDAVIRTVVIALLITFGYSMITHPQRATWYDLWSGVRVTPDPTPRDFPEKLREVAEGPLKRRAESHATYSRFFFVAVCLVFGLALAPILRDPFRTANLRLIERISEETPLEDYVLEGVAYQSGRDFAAWTKSLESQYVPLGTANGHGPAPAQNDPATTGTAGPAPAGSAPSASTADGPTTTVTSASAEDAPTTETSPRPVLFMSWVKQWGTASPGDVEALKTQLEALRAAVPGYAQETEAVGVKPEAPSPARLVCLLSDRFRFVIFSPGEGLIGVVEGPIDPGEGPLTDAWYEPAP